MIRFGDFDYWQRARQCLHQINQIVLSRGNGDDRLGFEEVIGAGITVPGRGGSIRDWFFIVNMATGGSGGGLRGVAIGGPGPFEALGSIAADTQRERSLTDRTDQELEQYQDCGCRATHDDSVTQGGCCTR